MPQDPEIFMTNLEETQGYLPASQLLTTEEVARLLRVDPSSVRRWRAERPPQGPPFIRLSERVVLYDVNDLQAWLDDRRTAPAVRRRAA
ncbi:helix-turn-helix transcriptional regulator [Streptomyces sp. NPDC021224]|uniref:helix-turn-helix transcriptional regulator n=1 Tax=unclassified Streptomyces TaxID=2593676 RepID=UPI0037A7BA1D